MPSKSIFSLCISDFFALRRCITNPKKPRSAMTAMPPTTPPAIAPVGGGLLEDVVPRCVDDGVLTDVDDGDEVACLLLVGETDDESGAPAPRILC